MAAWCCYSLLLWMAIMALSITEAVLSSVAAENQRKSCWYCNDRDQETIMFCSIILPIFMALGTLLGCMCSGGVTPTTSPFRCTIIVQNVIQLVFTGLFIGYRRWSMARMWVGIASSILLLLFIWVGRKAIDIQDEDIKKDKDLKN